MQQEFYTSCIKVNGIPLLPPLMTDNVKEEMRRYRSLAVEVEERIKNKQLLKCSNTDKCVQADIIKSVDELRSVKYSSDSDMSTHNTISDTNSDSHSKMTIVEPTRQVSEERGDEHDIQSPVSDVQQSEFQICLSKNTVNDIKPIISGANQNEYGDATETVMLNKDSESWKPEVPKTLDVVPIMLSDKEDSTSVSKESDNPPKLSRQGSYVLDTPSPMLLAHMHSELSNKEYVPTRTTSNISQRKQWNIAQSKVEWENTKIAVENREESNKTNHAQDLTSPAESIEPYQMNKSISSTEAVVSAEEYTDKSNITPDKHTENTDAKKQSSVEKSEGDSEISILSLATQLQESMRNENNFKTQVSYLSENEHRDKVKEYKNDDDVRMKLSVTSDKLLTVYRQIEEMHKRKMVELINRQRKEQALLQAEFQKQQKRLLSEIQKCSSEILRQVDASSVSSNQSLRSGNETNLGNIGKFSETKQQSNTNPSSDIDAESHSNNKVLSADHANVIVCPLEYIPSKNLYLLRHCKSHSVTNAFPAALDYTGKENLCDVTCNNNNNNDDDITNSNHKSYDYGVYRSSTVNRQLFPLDSNTTHVPVIDSSVYLDKHIRAVNIINAYARGYLVRRLLRTQRVITLKKIYKEALQCMLKLHVDAPLNLAEVDFLHRLQLQCDAASMNIVELFAQPPAKRMEVIAHDREIKQSRAERPTSARSYSFATQKTLARKNLKEFESTMMKYQQPVKKSSARSRCQTWTSDIRDKHMSQNPLQQTIRRSTSTGTVRKPWR